MDMGADTPQTFYTPAVSFSPVPSTPPSVFSRPPSTPETSKSSFSQTFDGTPCPANNAFAPLPDFSDRMEGVVFTSQKPRSEQPPATQAPPRNGVVAFNMQSATAQPAVSRAPPKNGVLSFTMQPAATQPKAALPAPAQPAPSQAPPRNGVLSFTMQSATTQPKAALPPSSQPAPSHAPSRNGIVSFTMQPATAQAAAALPPAAQPTPAQPTPVQPTQSQRPVSHTAVSQPPTVPVTKAEAASYPTWVRNDPAQVFKTPLWSVSIAPLWETVQTLPQLPAGTQLWELSKSMIPTVAQPPAVPVTKAAAASYPIWVRNDPAQVFKAPLWSVAIAPLWATVQTLPQLPPGAQVWELNKTMLPTVAQPSTNNISKQTPTAEPTSSHPPAYHEPATHHTVGASVPAATKVAQGPSFDDCLRAVVDGLTCFHISEPATWAWSEPSVFGQYMDKEKSGVFYEKLINAANTRLPGGSLDGGLREIKPVQATQQAVVVSPKPAVQNKEPEALPAIATNAHGDQNDTEPQQGTQEAAISQNLGELPTVEANGSSSSVPNAVIEEQPSDVMTSHEKSAETPNNDQAEVSFPDKTQSTTTTGVAVHNGNSDEIKGAEEPQPTDKGKGVAVPGQFDFNSSTFLPQNFSQVNNPFLNAPTLPTANAPITAQQLGGQKPIFGDLAAGGAASEERAYEVGSDEDPNVDVNFDFAKYFKRTAASGAATSSTPAASTSSAAAPVEGSPLAGASPAAEPSPVMEVSPTAEASLTAEPSPIVEANPTVEPSPIMEASPTAEPPPVVEASPTVEDSLPVEPSLAETSPSEASPSEADGSEISETSTYTATSLTTTSAESAPIAEASPPVETSPTAETSPLPSDSPAGPTAQASSPGPAASIPLSAPSPPPGGFDFTDTGPSPKPEEPPRGKNKRRRDVETECMYDEDDAHYSKTVIGWHPCRMMTVGHQYALLAQFKANPHVTYDEDYAVNMMNDMFYEIVPRIASELLFPTPQWQLAEQEDEARCLVDSMLEEELNEKSFDMVQEAYEPRFGVKFELWRNHLFDVFSDWYLQVLSPALPDLVHKMNIDDIKDLSEIFWDNVWKYMDDHPPQKKL